MKILRKMWANMWGYFWLPCPVCGEFFGGFEIGRGYITDSKGKINCVCKNCDFEAGIIEAKNGKVLYVSDNASRLIET